MKRVKRRLAKQVYAMELPVRRRAAKLHAAANRNEAMKALKADMLRSELMRLQGIINITPSNRATGAAIDQLKKHLKELAQ